MLRGDLLLGQPMAYVTANDARAIRDVDEFLSAYKKFSAEWPDPPSLDITKATFLECRALMDYTAQRGAALARLCEQYAAIIGYIPPDECLKILTKGDARSGR